MLAGRPGLWLLPSASWRHVDPVDAHPCGVRLRPASALCVGQHLSYANPASWLFPVADGPGPDVCFPRLFAGGRSPEAPRSALRWAFPRPTPQCWIKDVPHPEKFKRSHGLCRSLEACSFLTSSWFRVVAVLLAPGTVSASSSLYFVGPYFPSSFTFSSLILHFF